MTLASFNVDCDNRTVSATFNVTHGTMKVSLNYENLPELSTLLNRYYYHDSFNKHDPKLNMELMKYIIRKPQFS